MQAPTHILTGVLIQKTAGAIAFRPARYATISLLGPFSHLVLDQCAKLTYHPDRPLPDGFWLTHYATSMGLAAYLLRKNWRQYKVGIIAAVLPDFDWVLVWGLKLNPWRRSAAPATVLHGAGLRVLGALPLFRRLQSFPDWKRIRKSSLLEVLLCGALARGIWPRQRA